MTGLAGGLGGQPSLLITGAGVALFVMALSQVRQLGQVSEHVLYMTSSDGLVHE
jgi:hypothetical protein